MKLIRLTNDHYVVVDDSPKGEDFCIPIGTKYLDDTFNIREAITENIDYWAARKDYYIITHSTQPLASMKELIGKGYDTILPINIDEVKDLIGEVDVENKAKYKFPNDTPNGLKIGTSSYKQRGFISGYNQALEDNKKKYTFNQITDAISMAREINGKESYYRYSMEEIVQSVEPKTEWKVEFVDGKLKLK